jgi:hypothetical protein
MQSVNHRNSIDKNGVYGALTIGVNVLKLHLQTTLRTLIERNASQREIERVTGIDRKTIRSYQKRFAAERSNSAGVTTGSDGQIPPPRPPTDPVTAPQSSSACEPHTLGSVVLQRHIEFRCLPIRSSS